MKNSLVFLILGILILFLCRNKIIMKPDGNLVAYNRITGNTTWVSIESPGKESKEIFGELPKEDVKKLVVTFNNQNGTAYIKIYNPTSFYIRAIVFQVVMTDQAGATIQSREYRTDVSTPPQARGSTQLDLDIPDTTAKIAIIPLKVTFIKRIDP